MLGCTAFALIAIAQHGGWAHVLGQIAATRPEALSPLPPVHAATPSNSIELATIVILVLQGIFFAGSPTAGEGSTAQRFMAARNEAHAMAGQLFNCFLALVFRVLPLIGMGLVAVSIFWPASLAKVAPSPQGMIVIDDPVHAWAELVRHCRLPLGLVGLLISVEVAAYTSTLSALINWGGSFIINDIYRPLDPKATVRREIWVSRLTTLVLFVLASVVAILFVENMVGWFMFINSAMVIFLLPLSFFRFFWWRFNVWGELAAIALGLPISILVWFVLDFQTPEAHPMWQGLALLFGLSFVVLVGVTLLTPAEKPETLRRFYERCRPPGFWKCVRDQAGVASADVPRMGGLLANSALGILACLGLVVGTNAVFVGHWWMTGISLGVACVSAAWLVARVLKNPAPPNEATAGQEAETH
jgi:solute:Na+ symporter, SSS family